MHEHRTVILAGLFLILTSCGPAAQSRIPQRTPAPKILDSRATLANASSPELFGAALFQSLLKNDLNEVSATCRLDEKELDHLAAAKLDFQGYAEFCRARWMRAFKELRGNLYLEGMAAENGRFPKAARLIEIERFDEKQNNGAYPSTKLKLVFEIDDRKAYLTVHVWRPLNRWLAGAGLQRPRWQDPLLSGSIPLPVRSQKSPNLVTAFDIATTPDTFGAALFEAVLEDNREAVLSTCKLQQSEVEHFAALKADVGRYGDVCRKELNRDWTRLRAQLSELGMVGEDGQIPTNSLLSAIRTRRKKVRKSGTSLKLLLVFEVNARRALMTMEVVRLVDRWLMPKGGGLEANWVDPRPPTAVSGIEDGVVFPFSTEACNALRKPTPREQLDTFYWAELFGCTMEFKTRARFVSESAPGSFPHHTVFEDGRGEIDFSDQHHGLRGKRFWTAAEGGEVLKPELRDTWFDITWKLIESEVPAGPASSEQAAWTAPPGNWQVHTVRSKDGSLIAHHRDGTATVLKPGVVPSIVSGVPVATETRGKTEARQRNKRELRKLQAELARQSPELSAAQSPEALGAALFHAMRKGPAGNLQVQAAAVRRPEEYRAIFRNKAKRGGLKPEDVEDRVSRSYQSQFDPERNARWLMSWTEFIKPLLAGGVKLSELELVEVKARVSRGGPGGFLSGVISVVFRAGDRKGVLSSRTIRYTDRWIPIGHFSSYEWLPPSE